MHLSFASYRILATFQPDYTTSSYQAASIWQNMGEALHQSVTRVLNLLISILPGVLALLLAVAVMAGIGMLLSMAARRILTGLRFDDRLASDQSSQIADWSPSHSPTLLVTRAVLWASILLGLVIGISAFSASYSADSRIPYLFLPYLTQAVGAILLLFVGNLVARFLARSILIGAVNQKLQYARFLSLGVKWLVLVLTAAMALDHLHIGGGIVELAFGILFGGIVLTLALAIGLGSRDLVSRSIEKSFTSERSDRHPDPYTTHPTGLPVEETEILRHF